LSNAIQLLNAGKGSVISICGAAGTGKSRFVRDFRDSLNIEKIQWLEGHAYPYSQNTPYYPLIDLLSRAIRIEEDDTQKTVRKKVESGISSLIGEKDDVIPYIGSLFSLDYLEIENVSPEFWKTQLHKAMQATLSALGKRAPTIVCLEDLHWADPSTLELIHMLLLDYRGPILFLCIYRPLISLFSDHQIRAMANPYREIRLRDLSPSESQLMVESLLNTETIPAELQQFIDDKVEGNPFYIEEIINSLIESKTLIRANGGWEITRSISESAISSTIHGVISGRIDRLDKETKRILQEASVIGRAFFYEILRRITTLEKYIDRSLSGLEQLDLIKTRTIQPDLEYIFKHALTQEVVYKGLLKKERRKIHDRIGYIIEQLFHDRLSEFCETLAFHFKHGLSFHKAIEYLIKSGDKSLKRYAIEEAHGYYKEAFELLSNKPDIMKEEEALLIKLIIEWALVFYYRGDFRGLIELLKAHKDLAETLDDKARIGMFSAWYGFALYNRGKPNEAYKSISKALKIGEEIEDQLVICYACTWMAWTCLDLGLLNKAIVFGERAHEISKLFPSETYLYFKSLGALGFTYYFSGDRKKTEEAGKALVRFGQKHSNIRSLSLGYAVIGLGYVMDRDFPQAIESFQKSIQISADPVYSQGSKAGLGMSYLSKGQFQSAEKLLLETVEFSRKFGYELFGTPAQMLMGATWIAKGQFSQGLREFNEAQRICFENERRYYYAISEYIMGSIYSQIAQGEGEIKPSIIIRNIGFLVKNVPFARKKAEDHFNKAIELSKEIGAKGIMSQAYLDLGSLHKAKRKIKQAKECFGTAVQLLEKCEADVLLKQANVALESLQ
jgi:tetratricopeptide (TPR) repeat protein